MTQAARAGVALAIVVIFLFGGVTMLSSGYSDAVRGSGDETAVSNETFTVDEGNVTALNNSNFGEDVVYSEAETVAVYQNGTAYEDTGNWTWYDHNGTIRVQNQSSLTDGDDANVTYSYFNASDTQQTTKDTVETPVELGQPVILMAGMLVLLGAIGFLGRVS